MTSEEKKLLTNIWTIDIKQIVKYIDNKELGV